MSSIDLLELKQIIFEQMAFGQTFLQVDRFGQLFENPLIALRLKLFQNCHSSLLIYLFQMSNKLVYKSIERPLFNNPTLNISNTDLCVFLNSDFFYLPYIRQFVYFDRFCPIKQVNHIIIISSIM